MSGGVYQGTVLLDRLSLFALFTVPFKFPMLDLTLFAAVPNSLALRAPEQTRP